MKCTICLLVFTLCTITLSATAQASTKQVKTTKKKKTAKVQYGTASFYHNKFNGRKTANGQVFNQRKYTAAHNNVPLGTWLKVTNLRNKKTVIVLVTDRLHHRNKRLLDLSKAAANKLAFFHTGLLPVRVQVLGKSIPVTKSK